jgi:hypothetical protein
MLYHISCLSLKCSTVIATIWVKYSHGSWLGTIIKSYNPVTHWLSLSESLFLTRREDSIAGKAYHDLSKILRRPFASVPRIRLLSLPASLIVIMKEILETGTIIAGRRQCVTELSNVLLQAQINLLHSSGHFQLPSTLLQRLSR